MNRPSFRTEPNALIKCSLCGKNVSYFADAGSFFSEDGAVYYECQECAVTPAERAEKQARHDEITNYHETKAELWSAGKPHDYDAVMEALKRAGSLSEGALFRRQAA